jgi:hypothetical protein
LRREHLGHVAFDLLAHGARLVEPVDQQECAALVHHTP